MVSCLYLSRAYTCSALDAHLQLTFRLHVSSSDDPRDPLNWPTWKRELAYWNIVFATSLVGAVRPFSSSQPVPLTRPTLISLADRSAHRAGLRSNRQRVPGLGQQGRGNECSSRSRHRCCNGAPLSFVAETRHLLVVSQIPVSTVAIKWGRRPVYIWGAAFLLAGSIWSAAKPDLDNLLASRVIQGCGYFCGCIVT